MALACSHIARVTCLEPSLQIKRCLMRPKLQRSGLAILCFTAVALPLAAPGAFGAESAKQSHVIASVTVFASGLENPRGLKFGPDG
jgi:hypothetical protein